MGGTAVPPPSVEVVEMVEAGDMERSVWLSASVPTSGMWSAFHRLFSMCMQAWFFSIHSRNLACWSGRTQSMRRCISVDKAPTLEVTC